jgi:hypothetical protein
VAKRRGSRQGTEGQTFGREHDVSSDRDMRAGLLAGSLVAALRPPQYEATAVTAIVPARSAGFPGADSVSLAAPSFIAFATSPTKLHDVAS